MRKAFWLGNWGTRALACALFVILACGPGRMVSDALAQPEPLAKITVTIKGMGLTNHEGWN